MSGKVFTLVHPFEFKGARYENFTARRPKVRDLRSFIKNLEKDGVDAVAKVLSDLCEVDTVVISEIDVEDFGPMKKWFEDFLKPMLPESSES